MQTAQARKAPGTQAREHVHAVLSNALDSSGVAVLPPADVEHTLLLVQHLGFRFHTTMLDPWYNKGIGGERDDYREFVLRLLRASGRCSDHVYFWGFPEIVAPFVERIPDPLVLTSWLTWYYKNNPSVIRGWRSAQQACLHLSTPGVRLYPEHFLNEAQKQKQAEGKLRYMPGPASVIESSLLVGFVGRKEQTGHKAQKPEQVFEPLLLMTTVPGNVVLDPMSGSGTTGAVARKLGVRAVLCDHSEEYTQMVEHRLGVRRIDFGTAMSELLDELAVAPLAPQND